jgi:5-methylcytosine-specific restriction protein A
MPRNPNWSRDELILALDLYMQNGREQLGSSDEKVQDLSQLLNELPIHAREFRESEFRNANGVSMKLGNFLSLDPAYEGVGLERGSRLEKEVWEEFASDPYRLRQTATAIRNNYEQVAAESIEPYGQNEDDEEFREGKILTRLHKQKERSSRAVRRKKQKVLQETGQLACEVCSFDFVEKYGELGQGFAECHHRKPVAELNENQRTKLSDLAIVCANCHRMIHKSDPMMSVDDLRRLLDNTAT